MKLKLHKKLIQLATEKEVEAKQEAEVVHIEKRKIADALEEVAAKKTNTK